jgi:quercetin dioxygenase-like cupin family protein
MPMTITDWARVAPTQHPGDSGVAIWRTRNFGDIRVRMVEYSPGYAADHWCSKGHVILCLSGSLQISLENGATLELRSGQSYHVGDGDPTHRSATAEGATLFIVD